MFGRRIENSGSPDEHGPRNYAACDNNDDVIVDDEEKANLLTLHSHDDSHDHHHHHHHHANNNNNNADTTGPLTFAQMHHLIHDIHEYGLLKERLHWYTLYMFLLLLFIGLNLALLLANGLHSQDFMEEHYFLPFHLFSFWGVFFFTLVEAALLVSTNNNNNNDNNSNTSRRGSTMTTVFASVLAAFGAAVLYTLDPETFEVPAHWVEYICQFGMSMVNLHFVQTTTTTTTSSSHGSQQGRSTLLPTMAAVLVMGLSLLMMLLYGNVVWTFHHHMEGERAAHFVEFATDVLDGVFALAYAVQSYDQLQRRLHAHYQTFCDMNI